MTALPVGRPDGLPRYAIRLQGRLPARWSAWFDGMQLTTADDGTTVLAGPVADQAALHGVLQKVRDLGLPLISVNALCCDGPDPDPPQNSTAHCVNPGRDAT